MKQNFGLKSTDCSMIVRELPIVRPIVDQLSDQLFGPIVRSIVRSIVRTTTIRYNREDRSDNTIQLLGPNCFQTLVNI